MRLTLDTNVLIRAIVADDVEQTQEARRILEDTDEIILTLPALCEMAWVLRSYYRTPKEQIAVALRGLMASQNVLLDDGPVSDGLAVLDAGGDFADGVIASLGKARGADAFVSFDRQAIRILNTLGLAAREPA